MILVSATLAKRFDLMPDHRTFRWGILLAAGLLAACGTATPPAPPSPPDDPADAVAASPSSRPKEGTWFGAAAAQNSPETPRDGETGRSRQPLPRPNGPQVASLPQADQLPGPQDLTGLGADQLQALLGSPDFRRRDPPAELWQFRGPGCVLDTFLYADGAGVLRVKHVEARSRSVTRIPARDCYLGLLAKRKEGGGG